MEPLNVTLVTVEELNSSDVTLVNSNATSVAIENLESSNGTLGSEGKNIMGEKRRMEILVLNLLMLL